MSIISFKNILVKSEWLICLCVCFCFLFVCLFFCCSFLYMNINLELYINWTNFNISKLSILWLPTIASIPYAIIGNKPTENINKYNAYFDFRHVILTQKQTTKWFHKSNFILIITSTKIERKGEIITNT